MTSETMISATAISISVLGLVFQYFAWILSIRKDMAKISERLARQESKVELFWTAASSAISNMIKQPIHHRKDELMDKLTEDMQKKRVIGQEEMEELRKTLLTEMQELERQKDPKSLAYALALAYISQRMLEDKEVELSVTGHPLRRVEDYQPGRQK